MSIAVAGAYSAGVHPVGGTGDVRRRRLEYVLSFAQTASGCRGPGTRRFGFVRPNA